jgi:uncharacterized protein YjbI with pentapeptide repeats
MHKEHIDLLNQGVEVWNKWRIRNPDIVRDLIRADLRQSGLRNAYLSRANLSVRPEKD